MASVQIRESSWTRKGHGGLSLVADYEVFLNDVRLRGFSTHGNMTEGYWGAKAESEAVKYATAVADTLGVKVLRVRSKQ